MKTMFQGLFDGELAPIISVEDFLLCLFGTLLLGVLIAAVYGWSNETTSSFLVTLVLLPSVVCVVIMMVNGNVGTGVAVAGAFSLVRFRSAPGSAKEIVTLFLAMGAGLIGGMGYLGFAALFTLVTCLAFLLCSVVLKLGAKKAAGRKTVKITVPEDLADPRAFEEVLAEYTRKWELVRVKTVNMGSMFRLTYEVTVKDVNKEKQMIDRLRERNGNLEISVSGRENLPEL